MANSDALLEELDEEAQRALLAKLSYKFARNKTSEATDAQSRFWDSLCVVCDISRPLRGDQLSAFIKKFGRERFDLHVEAFDDFIDNAAGMKLQKARRAAMAELVLECVVTDIRRRDGAVTPTTVVNMMAYLPAAVDRAYPGYARAHLLHRIVPVSRAA